MLSIEDWLKEKHDAEYFAQLRTHRDYRLLCHTFGLNPKDDDSLTALEGYYKVYQSVVSHPDVDTSIIYRLRDLGELREKEIEHVFGDYDKYVMEVKAEMCTRLQEIYFSGQYDDRVPEAIFKDTLEKAKKLTGDLDADTLRSLRADYDKFVETMLPIYQAQKTAMETLVGSFPNELNKHLQTKLNDAQQQQLIEKIKASYNTDISPMKMQQIIRDEVEALTGEVISSDDYDSDAECVNEFTYKLNAIGGNCFNTALRECNAFSVNLANCSPNITKYFGLGKTHAQLTTEGSVYAPRGIEHSRNMNMVWMLANIHAGRSFRIISQVSEDNKYRKTYSRKGKRLSAFASELVALEDHNYRVMLTQSGTAFLEPPQVDNLTTVRYDRVRQNMEEADERARVDATYDKLSRTIEQLLNPDKSHTADKAKQVSAQQGITADDGAEDEHKGEKQQQMKY